MPTQVRGFAPAQLTLPRRVVATRAGVPFCLAEAGLVPVRTAMPS